MLTSFYSLAEHQPWMVNSRLLAEFELEFDFFFVFYVGSLSIQIVGNAKLVKFISSVFCPFYVLIHSSF